MAIARERRMTVAEYLAWEERQELKHEYIDGEVIEMPGATWDHDSIVVNISEWLAPRLKGTDCRLCTSDMRIQIAEDRYVYADLCAVCGPPLLSRDRMNLLNPILVVEVTSPSSQMRDRIDKLDYYQAIPSIEAYLIVEQDRMRVDLFTRANGGWNMRSYSAADDVIPLAALECELALAEVYRGVELAEA